MLSRPLTTLACSLVVGLVAVPAARAALRMDVTASTAEIHAGVTKQVTFTVTLTSDGGDQRFTLWDALPRFGPPRGGAGLLEGSELSPEGPPAIEGPARLVGPAAMRIGTPACSPTSNRFHGSEPLERGWEVLVPAQTVSSLRLAYALSASRPWPAVDPRVVFTADPRTLSGAAPTLAAPLTARSSPIRLTGRTGVRIALRARPRIGFGAMRPLAVIARRKRVTVLGTTSPRLAHARIQLRLERPGTRGTERWRVARTDRRGRFRVTGRFGRPGYHEIWARYRSHRPGVADDYACPLTFRVAG